MFNSKFKMFFEQVVIVAVLILNLGICELSSTHEKEYSGRILTSGALHPNTGEREGRILTSGALHTNNGDREGKIITSGALHPNNYHEQYNNLHRTPAVNQSSKLERAALYSQSKIFPFLNQLFNRVPYSNSYFGPYRYSNKPDCASNGMYCLYDKGGYPNDVAHSVIDRFYDDVRNIYASLHRIPVAELLYYDNRTHRYREGGNFVCESSVQYVRPGWARSIRGEWLAIVNTDNFPQTVRVEECKFAGKRCEFLPPCYKSTCVQRFSFEKLLAFDSRRPTGKPFIDVFEIPTACSCFVENFIYY